jgi:hypothetical protein
MSSIFTLSIAALTRAMMQVGIVNLLLLSIQIFFLVRLFRNPIINPPLDEHGMPKPINPLDGTVLPMGPDGQPILPPELRPAKEAKTTTDKGKDDGKGNDKKKPSEDRGASEWESEVSDSSLSPSDSEMEEKKLLAKELGRKRRRGQQRGKEPSRRGYNAV